MLSGLLYNLYYIVSSNNKQQQAIYAAAYLMEVKSFKNDRWEFLYRLLNTVSFILFFLCVFQRIFKAFLYWLYIVLLIPVL
jgi:type IV secretory pathway component VirB8